MLKMYLAGISVVEYLNKKFAGLQLCTFVWKKELYCNKKSNSIDCNYGLIIMEFTGINQDFIFYNLVVLPAFI